MKLNKNTAILLGLVDYLTRKAKPTPAGNGKAVPQYKLDKQGQVKPLVDKNGVVITHDLQADINKLAPAADYKNVIKNGGVIGGNGVNWVDTDYTQLGNANELLRVKNELEAKGLTPEKLIAIYNTLAANVSKQEIKQENENKEVK